MNIQIRKATSFDMDQVYLLVYKLAEFELSKDQITIDVETYIKDFKDNRFDVIVAEDLDIQNDAKIIGIAFYYWAYSTWKGKYLWLEDFIVVENYRNKKIGMLLFESFIQLAFLQKSNLIRWQVLDWNESAIQFYKKYNAEFQTSWLTCKLSKQQLEFNT